MAKSLDLPVRLNAPQFAKYHEVFDPSGKPYRRRTHFLGWGRGVGKTHFARSIWWLLVAAFDGKLRTEALEPFRGVRITSVCPTLKQWKEINAAGIESELAPDGKWGILRGKFDRQTGHVRFPGGSIIRPFPATEYNARTSRGLRTDVLDAEEFDDIEASVYDAVAVPWLSEPWSLGIELLRGTPTRGRHGLWYRSQKIGKIGKRLRDGDIDPATALKSEQAQAILAVFDELPADEWPPDLPPDPGEATLAILSGFYASHATYRDARETVSPIAVARAKATTPASTFKREWEADPDAGTGLVYGGVWEEDFHVRLPPADVIWSELLASGDKGYEDPGVLLLGGKLGHGQDSVIWILDEVYEQHRTVEWWCRKLGEWVQEFGVRKLYYDPSAAGDKDSFRSSCGVNTPLVENAVDEGISAVANMLLKRPDPNNEGAFYARLYIHPRCVNLIRELGIYRRKADPNDRDRFTDDIVGRDDHTCDALKYMISGHYGLKKTLAA